MAKECPYFDVYYDHFGAPYLSCESPKTFRSNIDSDHLDRSNMWYYCGTKRHTRCPMSSEFDPKTPKSKQLKFVEPPLKKTRISTAR